MLRIIALAIVVIVAGVLAFAATRPDSFAVERSLSIKAPPEKIYPFLTDLRGYVAWSPYETRDPAMQRTYSGAATGKGAVYDWNGNSQVGAGRMEIAEADPPSHLTIRLDMLKPMEGHNIVEFTLRPQGDATDVTWAMHGPMPFISKIISIFVDMDSMIGKDFETGLAGLKKLAEAPEAPAAG